MMVQPRGAMGSEQDIPKGPSKHTRYPWTGISKGCRQHSGKDQAHHPWERSSLGKEGDAATHMIGSLEDGSRTRRKSSRKMPKWSIWVGERSKKEGAKGRCIGVNNPGEARVRDWTISGDLEHKQDAPDADHPGNIRGTLEWVIWGGEQHTRDLSIPGIAAGAAIPRIGSSGDEGLVAKEEQQEDAGLEHLGWRARRKGEMHPSDKQTEEPKDEVMRFCGAAWPRDNAADTQASRQAKHCAHMGILTEQSVLGSLPLGNKTKVCTESHQGMYTGGLSHGLGSGRLWAKDTQSPTISRP